MSKYVKFTIAQCNRKEIDSPFTREEWEALTEDEREESLLDFMYENVDVWAE